MSQFRRHDDDEGSEEEQVVLDAVFQVDEDDDSRKKYASESESSSSEESAAEESSEEEETIPEPKRRSKEAEADVAQKPMKEKPREKPPLPIKQVSAREVALPLPIRSPIDFTPTANAALKFSTFRGEPTQRNWLSESENDVSYDKQVRSAKIPFNFSKGVFIPELVYTDDMTRRIFKPDITNDLDMEAAEKGKMVNRNMLFITEILIEQYRNKTSRTVGLRFSDLADSEWFERFNQYPNLASGPNVLGILAADAFSEIRNCVYDVSKIIGTNEFKNFAHFNSDDLLTHHIVDATPNDLVGIRIGSPLHHLIEKDAVAKVDNDYKAVFYDSDVAARAVKKWKTDIEAKVRPVNLESFKLQLFVLTGDQDARNEVSGEREEISGVIVIKYVSPRSVKTLNKNTSGGAMKAFLEAIK